MRDHQQKHERRTNDTGVGKDHRMSSMKHIAVVLFTTLFTTAALAQSTVTGPNASTVGDIATFNNTTGSQVTDTPVLGAAHGGTGQASIPAHGVPIGQGTSSFNTATTGTPGAVLVDQGSGNDPQFKVLTGDFTCAASGYCALSATANVLSFGADPTGASDSTPAFNAAIAAVPSGGRIAIPPGSYKLNSPTNAITATGVQIQCQSQASTYIGRNFTSGNTITFTNAQFGTVRDCSFFPLVRPTSGYEISFGQGCFECEARNVTIQYGYNGIEIFNAAETRLQYVDIRYLFGPTGIYYHGSLAFGGSFGATLTKVVTDNPYPLTQTTSTTWSANTAYTAGQMIFVNGNIYQAGNNGTSASSGTGPAGLPSGTTPASAFSNTIADGSVNWFYESSGLEWIVQDSYAYSLRCITCALLDGLDSFAAVDSANTGTSYPKFDFFDDLESDHAFASGVLLNAGINFGFVNSWIGSSLAANGMATASTFKGELSISNSRIAGNCQAGIFLTAGSVKNVIYGNSIASNSVCGTNTYNGITVAAGSTQFIISNNFLGKDPDITTNAQASGVNVATGASDYYTIVGNICGGENITNCVSDGGTGTHKYVPAGGNN